MYKASETCTEVNHLDGDPSNNKAGNLEWVTPSENHQHAIKAKLRFAHFTKERAESVRKLYRTGSYTQKMLAKQFNCSQQTISNVINKITNYG